MKLVTGAQMREIDRRAQQEYGVSELVLMENAGVQITESILAWLGAHQKKKVLILAGSGNNGGDALVAARHLLNVGKPVQVLQTRPAEKLGASCRAQLYTLEKMGCTCHVLEEMSDTAVRHLIHAADLVVDGIYGTGFHGRLPENIARLAEWLQQAQAKVLAIDIPSGVLADTGRVEGTAFRADVTVTLALPKPGLYLGKGAAYAGKIEIKAIGMPFPLLEDTALKWHLIEEKEILPMLPVRLPDSHKGTYGHTAVIGGCAGMIGAVRMAARSALKTGSGCVTALIPGSMQLALQTAEMELMTHAVSETVQQQFSEKAAGEVLTFLQADERKNVYVLGPGLGRYPEAGAFVRKIICAAGKPMVIDADGLMALAGQTHLLKGTQNTLILTPHPGEMSALTGLSVAEIEENRLEAAARYAQEWQSIVVLKGHHTLIAAPDGRVWMNTTGNAGMATAGSGDVLSGLIAGLIAQGITPLQAAVAGVYIHGAAGDFMAAQTGQHGLIAGDLLEGIPQVMKQLVEKNSI